MVDVEERLSRIIASNLAVDGVRITPAARFDADLGAGPFGLMEVVVSVEDAFNIAIPNDAMEQLRTVGDPIALIKGSVH